MIRVPFDEMRKELERVLLSAGFNGERAELCATIFAETTRDGVYSHGIMRFPYFLKSFSGKADVNAAPKKVGSIGVIEQWDGNKGPGPLNAHAAMLRAIEIASENGLGCVALRNTSHWMRAGTYGLVAADAGYVGICWTNTTKLIPPYGSDERKVGNNPLVIAIPRNEGPFLLDMAMSQFSNGRLDVYREAGQTLPVPGGYDQDGELSYDPTTIQSANRPLPIGHWKGIGLAMGLDFVGSLLSGGQSTVQIAKGTTEQGVSQTFMAIDIQSIAGDRVEEVLNETIEDLQAAATLEGQDSVSYPGQRMLQTRSENLELGVPVDKKIWDEIRGM